MSYRTALRYLKNVKISNGSPRNVGETSKRSEWQEIESLPWGFAERISLIKKLASENHEVAVKTATAYGRARLFVRKQP